MTKLGVDETYLFRVLRLAERSLVQDASAAANKAKKSAQRKARTDGQKDQREATKAIDRSRRARRVAALAPGVD